MVQNNYTMLYVYLIFDFFLVTEHLETWLVFVTAPDSRINA